MHDAFLNDSMCLVLLVMVNASDSTDASVGAVIEGSRSAVIIIVCPVAYANEKCVL